MNEVESDSEYSDTSGGDDGSTSTSSSSSSSSSNNDGIVDDDTELAKIEKQLLRLPKGLCENAKIFKEFFSMDTWECLPSNFQAYLKNKYLPNFGDDVNNDAEQEKTLKMLFNNEITCFNTSPLNEFQKNLEDGNYRPDILKLRESIKKSRRREQKYQECERISQLAKTLVITREKLLRSAYDAPPGTVLKCDPVVMNTGPKLNNSIATFRARKRFYEEIINISNQIGFNITDLSDDESELTESFEDIKNRKELINQVCPNNETKIIGTMCRHKNDNLVPSNNCLSILDDSNFKQFLMAHKKRKLEEPDRPEFETNDIRLRDVHARTQNSSGYKKLNVGRPLGRKSLLKLAAKQSQIDGGASICAPTENQQQQQKEQLLHQALHPSMKGNELYLPPNNSMINQQQICQQKSLLNSNARLLPPSVAFNKQDEIEIKEENLSDNENHAIESTASTTQKTISSTSRRTIEDNVMVKKRNLPPPNVINNSNKGSIITSPNKKLIVNVNGTAVPETIHQNLTKTNTKDKSNATELITLPQYGKVKVATLSDLEGIDMMHIPVDLDESGNMNILNEIKQEHGIELSKTDVVCNSSATTTPSTTITNSGSVELMQETHACFLSLIRDIFCSTPNHRIKLDDLKAKICTWLSNPITALNDWYSLADNWLTLIPSAIHFLAGEFIDQPEDFVPYIEYKPQLNIYQWIGAGRDSDQHLLQLCNYWLNRRHEMGCKPTKKFEFNTRKLTDYDEVITSERPTSPPPPRCPTNWTVRPATAEELVEFRAQEKKRFENPHKAFTYRMHGYESIVGPVKGIYTQILSLAKARGHNMLTQDRPNYVTILTLVRDATARLPNGEGTRADICELLKSSQYISPDAQDSVLTTIVSGALDRMHTEHDPCVRYDTKRKIWIYLHRNRTEEEFERLHQETQGLAKPKKVQNRKVKPKAAKVTQMLPTTTLPPPPLAQQQIHDSSQQQQQKQIISNSSSPINTNSVGSITSNIPVTLPTLKLSPTSPQKVPLLTMKPSPIPKSSIVQDCVEQTDAEAAIDAQASPAVLQKPQNFHHQQKQSPTISPTVTDTKKIPTTVKKAMAIGSILSSKAVTNPPVHVQPVSMTSDASGGTMVAVSTNSSGTSKQLTAVLPTSSNPPQAAISGSGQNTQISVGGKKFTTVKPILVSGINQNQPTSIMVSPSGSQIVNQQTSGTQQGFIIPLNISNSDQIKTLSTVPSTLIAAGNLNPKLIKNNQPPTLTTTINARSAIVQQGGKNFVRVATTTSQAGKSLLNPQITATNFNLHQQKLIGNTITVTNTQQQQQKNSIPGGIIRTQIQKGGTATVTSTIKSNQTLTASQQKQILQNIIAQQRQQQKQQLQQQQQNATTQFNAVMLPSGNQVVSAGSMQQNKPIIISSQANATPGNVQTQPHHVHKIIASSAAATLTSNTINTIAMTGTVQQSPTSTTVVNNAVVTNVSGNQQQSQQASGTTTSTATANIINPQIIQIHQTSRANNNPTATQITGKVQTLNASSLTPQQQQSLLQSIKQQQLKMQQHNQQNQQQSIIIKQQPTVFQQIQKSSSTTPTTVSVSVGTSSPKNVVTSLIGTNVSNLISTSGGTSNVIQQQTISPQNIIKQQPTIIQQQNITTGKTINIGNQQQTLTRVIKSATGTSILQPQIISSGAGTRSQISGNPVMAKVLTNSSGQIISLENLLQKQGIAPGTAIRVAGTKTGQTNLIQLTGTPGSQITQYAVVSQGRNLISVGTPQRLIATQAGSATGTNTSVVTSLSSGNVITKLNEHQQKTLVVTAAPTTVTNSSSTAQSTSGQGLQQNQPKVITANQIQSLTAQQLVNAKVVGKSGTTTGIRMVNASNLNIAHLRGKPVIIASKPTNIVGTNNQQASQNLILQNSGNNANLMIGGQALKVQGNVVSPTNVQVLNQSSSQHQTVVLGNQILKVQQAPHTIKQQTTATGSPVAVAGTSNIITNNVNTSGITTTITNTNTNTGNAVVMNATNTANITQQPIPKTVVLGSTGQTIRVQSPQIAMQTTGGTVSTQGGQSMILGTAVKGATIKGSSGQQRVVLAVQGGGQILLPPGFQGGAINLKSLQGLKVVSIGQQQHQQQQQQNKGNK